MHMYYVADAMHLRRRVSQSETLCSSIRFCNGMGEMSKKAMDIHDLSKEAQKILYTDYKNRFAAFFCSFLFLIVDGFLCIKEYWIMALFLLYMPIWIMSRYYGSQKDYFAELLEKRCQAVRMAEVYSYRYEHHLTEKTRKNTAALAARAWTYSGDKKNALLYCEKTDLYHALYEKMFAAFVAEDREDFYEGWKSYLALAPQLKEKSKLYMWYHKSFEKLDIYHAYMDGEYKLFFEETEEKRKLFTQAELVLLSYKKACLLSQDEPETAEQAFYYVLDKGGSMICVTQAKEQLQSLFSAQDQSTGWQGKEGNQDNLPS